LLIRYGKDEKGRPIKKAVVYTKDEHKIDVRKIDPDCMYVIQRLRDCGFTAYVVGGAVRDLIIGNNPKDFDIVTDATPSKIKRIFRNSRIIGKRFRLVHIFFGPKIFEVSTFRSIVDGSVGNAFGSIDEDVQRRDFSLNALYYDPLQQQVIDYVGGFEDIKKHVITPVIPLDRIFVEDPVRMLRAIKYSVSTNSRMSHSLKSKIRHSAVLLSQVSPSRLTEELLKMINSGHMAEIVKEALDTEVFIYLQPQAANLLYNSREFEKDYMHSLSMIDYITNNEPDARLGKKLYYLIYDFTKGLTDWQKEIEAKTSLMELFSRTWKECRNFVLPMNPMRRELEWAVREVLTDLGIPSSYRKKKKN